MCLSVRLSVDVSVCLSVCLSLRFFIDVSVCLSVCLSVCRSVYPSVCLSVGRSFGVSVGVSACLFVCLSTICTWAWVGKKKKEERLVMRKWGKASSFPLPSPYCLLPLAISQILPIALRTFNRQCAIIPLYTRCYHVTNHCTVIDSRVDCTSYPVT